MYKESFENRFLVETDRLYAAEGQRLMLDRDVSINRLTNGSRVCVCVLLLFHFSCSPIHSMKDLSVPFAFYGVLLCVWVSFRYLNTCTM